MSKRAWMVLVPVGLIVAGTVAYLGRPQEPVYRGKPASVWARQLIQSNAVPAQQAFQAIGPRMIPIALHTLFPQPYLRQRVYRQLWLNSPSAIRPRLPQPAAMLVPSFPPRGDPRYDVTSRVTEAIARLGPSAVPPLIDALKNSDENVRAFAAFSWWYLVASQDLGPQMLNRMSLLIDLLSDRNPFVRMRAANILGEIGPDARIAVPALIGALNARSVGDADAYLGAVAQALGRIGPAARPAVPKLTALLQYPSSMTRLRAAVALGRITGDVKPTVHVLINEIATGEDQNVSLFAIENLGKIGPKANSAFPVILKFLQSQDELLPGFWRDAIAQTLKRIDPAAATKAGIK
ncbi:MAG: HEAT repeat domain-containing protein [Limisphaerales bacterium]